METYASGLCIALAPMIAVTGASIDLQAHKPNWTSVQPSITVEAIGKVEIPTTIAQERCLSHHEQRLMQQALLASVEIIDGGELI